MLLSEGCLSSGKMSKRAWLKKKAKMWRELRIVAKDPSTSDVRLRKLAGHIDAIVRYDVANKTKTLTNRYAYIVKALGISPSNILCVTFTNKAAQEMRNRVRGLLNSGQTNDFICTYHGFCVKVLREDIHKLSYPSGFTILDTEDQKSILSEIYEEMGLKHADITYKTIFRYISIVKHSTPYIEHLIICYSQSDKLCAEDTNI